MRGRPQLHVRAAGPICGRGRVIGRQALQSVADVPGHAARVDVAQPHEHIGVSAARSKVHQRRDRSDDLEGPIERRARVRQDVRPGLELRVVAPCAAPQDRAAQRGGRVRRVVPVGIRAGRSGRCGRQAAVPVQVPELGERAGRRPVRQVAPLLGAGDVHAHWRTGSGVGTVDEVAAQYLDRSSGRLRGQTVGGVGPRADGQVDPPAGVPQTAEVPKLAWQEDVVPPGDEIDGRLDILDAGAEDPVVPVRMGRVSIREPFLVIGQPFRAACGRRRQAARHRAPAAAAAA